MQYALDYSITGAGSFTLTGSPSPWASSVDTRRSSPCSSRSRASRPAAPSPFRPYPPRRPRHDRQPTTRKDLMKPVQLLGLAFVAALFAGFVTLMSMGFFQTRPADQIQRALIVALVAAGATFIIVLVSVALMLLAVDPSKVTATVDRPLLLPKDAPHATPGRLRRARGSACRGLRAAVGGRHPAAFHRRRHRSPRLTPGPVAVASPRSSAGALSVLSPHLRRCVSPFWWAWAPRTGHDRDRDAAPRRDRAGLRRAAGRSSSCRPGRRHPSPVAASPPRRGRSRAR